MATELQQIILRARLFLNYSQLHTTWVFTFFSQVSNSNHSQNIGTDIQLFLPLTFSVLPVLFSDLGTCIFSLQKCVLLLRSPLVFCFFLFFFFLCYHQFFFFQCCRTSMDFVNRFLYFSHYSLSLIPRFSLMMIFFFFFLYLRVNFFLPLDSSWFLYCGKTSLSHTFISAHLSGSFDSLERGSTHFSTFSWIRVFLSSVLE